MKCKYLILLASMGFAALLLGPSPALAAATLGSAASFGILGASTVTCTVAGAVTGDVGVSPGTAITGFNPDCTLTGTLHFGDAVALQAHVDAELANLALAAQPCTNAIPFADATQLAGQTFSPGVYCFAGSAFLNGTLNLTGTGTWIFRMGSTIITGVGESGPASVLVNGQPTCNGADVFWQIGSSATIGTGTHFVGTIIAVASIGMDPNAHLDGRALALNGAVTLSGSNTVSVCGSGGSIPPPGPPGCKVKVICDCDDHHDGDSDHHDRDGDRHDRDGDHHDGDNDHHDNDGSTCHDRDDDHHDRDGDHHDRDDDHHDRDGSTTSHRDR